MTTIVLDGALPAGTYTLTPVGVQPPGPTGPAPGPTGPTGPTAAPPPTTGCTDTWGGGQDADWSPMTEVQVFPQHAVSANDPRGVSIRFVADAGKFPNGFKIDVQDQSSATLPKNVCISACPHSFVPVCAAALKIGAGNQWSFHIRYSGNPAVLTVLLPGRTYYLNMQPTNAGETVSSQFVAFSV